MTEQEILQNAEEYAHKVNVFAEDESIYLAAKDGYVSGAHSRDEEIKELKLKLANKSGEVADIEFENALLKIKLNKLRNQQISVEDKKSV